MQWENILIWLALGMGGGLVIRLYLRQAEPETLWRLSSILLIPNMRHILFVMSILVAALAVVTVQFWLYIFIFLLWVPRTAKRWLYKRILESPEIAIEYLSRYIEH
ncbi:MAG: hypothetical protein KC708_22260, partial [Anaerolineae bacterium]|nr:hypothetical protein [Anaerolineae bacterium]